MEIPAYNYLPPPEQVPSGQGGNPLRRTQRIYVRIENGIPVNVPISEHGACHYVIDERRLEEALRNAPPIGAQNRTLPS